MKRFTVLLIGSLLLTAAAHAWPACSGNWIQVPAGTSTANGAVVTENGQTFQCQKPAPTPTPTPTATNANTNTNSNTNSNSNANVNNNSSKSSSSSTSTASANQNQAQQQNQNQAQTANGGSATSTASASNNGNGSNNSTYSNTTTVAAPKIPVETAVGIAPYPTANCSKGYGGGVQTMPIGISGGFSKIDENCAILETARSFDSYGERYAACKIKVENKYAKKAHVTLEDCMRVVVVVAPAPVVVPAPVPVPNIIVNIPAPVPLPVVAPVPVTTNDGTLRSIGTCKLNYGKPTNVCYRFLDDAVLALNGDANARIVIDGPMESTNILPYLSRKVSRSRIELRLSDEANNNLTVATWSAQ